MKGTLFLSLSLLLVGLVWSQDQSEHHHHHHHPQEDGGKIAEGEHHHHHHHGEDKKGGHHHHHHHDDKDKGKDDHHHHHHHHDDKGKDDHHHHHHHDKNKDDHHHHHHHTHQHHHTKQYSHDEEAVDDGSCKDLVPGSHSLVHGIDLNTLDFFPMGEKSSDMANGFVSAVFSFSCQGGHRWSDPSDGHHGQKYGMPDDFQDVRPVATGNMQFSSDVATSVHEVKQSLEVQAGVSASYKGISGSASGGYKTAKENILKESKSVAMTTAHQSAWEIELKDRIRLSEKFHNAVKGLPEHFGHHQAEYGELIQTFGTHYFSVGRFGGNLVVRTEFDSSFTSTHSRQEIKQQVELQVPLVAKASVSVSARTAQFDEKFDSHSSSSIHYFGGSANLNQEDALDKWYEGVKGNPWLFSGKLEPLYKAVAAHSSLAAKATEMEKATKVYLARASLADLEETFQWKPEVKEKMEGDSMIKERIGKVRKFFSEDNSNFHMHDIDKNIKRLRTLLETAHK